MVNEHAELLAKARERLESTSEQPDEYEKVAMAWAVELKKMDSQQQLFAKKAINDIIFEGQMGTLTRDSVSINAHIKRVSMPFSSSTPRSVYYNDQQLDVTKITQILQRIQQPFPNPATQYSAESSNDDAAYFMKLSNRNGFT